MTTQSTMAGADVDRIASEQPLPQDPVDVRRDTQGRGDLGIPFDTAQT